MKKRYDGHTVKVIGMIVLLILSFCISYKYTSYREKSSVNKAEGSKAEKKNGLAQDAEEQDEDESINTTSISGGIGSHDEEYVIYNVKKGDCLNKICKENVVGYTLSKAKALIMEKNDLEGEDDVKEGMKLLIPYKDTDGWIEYRVRPGDSLLSIVKKFFDLNDDKTLINVIREKNSMSSDEEPEVDQRLLIPDECR